MKPHSAYVAHNEPANNNVKPTNHSEMEDSSTTTTSSPHSPLSKQDPQENQPSIGEFNEAKGMSPTEIDAPSSSQTIVCKVTNTSLAKQTSSQMAQSSLTQNQEENLQEIYGTPMQIQKNSTEYTRYVALISQDTKFVDDIISYTPVPQYEKDTEGNNLDCEHNKYCDKISEFKKMIKSQKEYPTILVHLQNKTNKKINDFKRIQTDINTRAKEVLSISYNITKESFLDIFKENEIFISTAIEFRDTTFNEIEGLRLQKVSDIIADLKFFLNKIVKSENVQLKMDEIETLETDIAALFTNRERKSEQLSSLYTDTIKEIYEKDVEILYINKLLKSLNESIVEQNRTVEEYTQKKAKSAQMDEKSKDDQLNKISKQLQQLQQQMQGQFENEQKDKELQQQQKMDKLKQINDLSVSGLSGGGDGSMNAKSCFHYIYVVDESGSFAGDPHNQAVNGIMQSVNSLNPNDYVTVIKFESSATVKFPKTKKCSLNTGQLSQQISHCVSGGTSFISAFNQLEQVISNNVLSDEFPVVIFITDGQDSSNINANMGRILQSCGNLIFFSIGYGSINEMQLRTIADVMNKTSGCKKQIGSKTLQLFYHHQTPQQLFISLQELSQQSNKVSMQDIEEFRKQIEKNFKSTTDSIADFYNSSRGDLQKQMKTLIEEKSALESSDKSAAEKKYEILIQNVKNNIDALQLQISNKQKLLQDQEAEKELSVNTFKTKIPDSKKESTLDEIRSEEQNKIDKDFNNEKNVRQTKINQLKKEISAEDEQYSKNVEKYGFRSLEKFNKFYNEITNLQQYQGNFAQLLNSVQNMIDNLISVSKLLERCINKSQNDTKALAEDQNFIQDKVFEYYSNLDETIVKTDQGGSIEKIVFYTDNTVQQIAKECGKLAFYKKVLLEYKLEQFQGLLQADQKTVEKEFKKSILQRVLQAPASLKKHKDKMDALEKKLEDLDNQIREQENKLLIEHDDKKINDIEKKIETCEKRKEMAEQELEKEKDALTDEEEKFEEKFFDEIKIARQLVTVFIKAIKQAVLRHQYCASVRPFKDFVSIQAASYKALKEY